MNSTLNSKIEGAIDHVARLSYSVKSEKESVQEIIDRALDELLSFKTIIEKKTAELRLVNELLQFLSWIDEPINEESLVKINMIEVLTRELNERIQKEIKSIKATKLLEICPSVLENYFNEAEYFEENINLIHQIFFELRGDREFLDLISQI